MITEVNMGYMKPNQFMLASRIDWDIVVRIFHQTHLRVFDTGGRFFSISTKEDSSCDSLFVFPNTKNLGTSQQRLHLEQFTIVKSTIRTEDYFVQPNLSV